MKYVGTSVPRKEDRRLLRGKGLFVADIKLAGMLHVAFARSTIAHGRIRSVDTLQAAAAPGVVAVLSGRDLRGELPYIPGMQNRPPKLWRDAVVHNITIPDQPIIADEKIRYVGEAFAVVVAESRAQAEDAAELIFADFESLTPVSSMDEAVYDGAPLIHETLERNVFASFRGIKGNMELAFASDLKTIQHQFINHRYTAMPLECRGVIANYDHRSEGITVYSSTQMVHSVQREIAARLNIPEARVRCVAPDVGGGFGVKGHVYPEDILIPYLAKRLERPVRWIEDRQEHILNSTHARDDRHDVRVSFRSDGRVVALRDKFEKDSGAYSPVGSGQQWNTVAHLLGPYDIPNCEMLGMLVATNKTPNAPYRGAGRPEAMFVIERIMDLVAHELDLDPIKVRLTNMIGADKMPYHVGLPYRDGSPIIYDSGDYPASVAQAIGALGGLDEFRAHQRDMLQKGRFVGLGLGTYVEGTGAGPFESATVRLDASGTFYVGTGACSQGQGHETVFAQVAADEWGVTPDKVTVVVSDTAAVAIGYGTIASRSGVTASNAIRLASSELRKKVFEIGAHILECSADDLEIREGFVSVKGVADLRLSLKEIALAGRPGWDNRRPPNMPGGLEVTAYFEPPTVTWAYGTHAAVVEIEQQTGEVRVQKYVVAHDAGVIINPRIVEGQIIGGVCQGIGGALFEEIIYDDQAQILTGSLADYLMPTASDMPDITVLHSETPSPLNSLGVKGVGEGGAIAPASVLTSAVCDALRPLKFEIFSTPIRQAAIAKALLRYYEQNDRL